jgi:hypothetical protein
MGADCIISGIRAQIAQTIVHLGLQLDDCVIDARYLRNTGRSRARLHARKQAQRRL